MQNPWKTVAKQEVYSNPWISVSHRDVITPSGTAGIYGVVHFKNLAVGIVPLDQDNNTWLVGQFRYPLNLYSWEIPEGGCPEGTSPLESAQRELLEETGITAKKWTPILDFYISNSVTDERALAFIARDLTFGEARPEETEELQIKKLPFGEVYEMVMRGEITDSLSMISVMKIKQMMDRGEL